jgi:hypothetical protein
MKNQKIYGPHILFQTINLGKNLGCGIGIIMNIHSHIHP